MEGKPIKPIREDVSMNKTIIIAPWAKSLRNGKENAKNYPFWPELVKLLKQDGFNTIQIGIHGETDIGANEKRLNLSMGKLENLIKENSIVITVDSFIQHFCWYLNKPAIVIWGKSDPEIFGHPENINLLKDRVNLRLDPFRWWEDVEASNDLSIWVDPQTIFSKIKSLNLIN